MAIFGCEVSSEGFDNVWASEKITPGVVHELHTVIFGSHNAESKVGTIVGQWKAPRVTRQKVLVEPDVQCFRCTAGDVADVLAKGMHFSEISRRRKSECFADGGPHAIGGNDIVDVESAVTIYFNRHTRSIVLGDGNECCSFMNRDAEITTVLDECMVKLMARCNGSEHSTEIWQVSVNNVTVGCS